MTAPLDTWEQPAVAAPEPPGRPTPGRLALLVGGVVGIVVAANLLVGGTSTPPTPQPTPVPSYPTLTTPDRLGILVAGSCAVPRVGGLALAAPGGQAVERRQCDDPGGAPQQAVVVRRSTSAGMGEGSAVVTWPLPAAQVADTGLRPSAYGDRTELTWPLDGQYARIRGDLTEPELIDLAQATRVGTGGLLVSTSADFTTAYIGRRTPDVLHEIRYDAPALGADQARLFGGPVVAGVQNGVALEDDLYATGARQVGAVGPRPVVLARMPYVAVAWELPGSLIAYVQSSRTDATPALVTALLSLARQATVLEPDEFERLR